MNIFPLTFKPSSDNPEGLVMTAKKYTRQDNSECGQGSGFMLVMLHGTGFHKECWEPVISNLFGTVDLRIREIWSLEWQTHGESALLNADALKGAQRTIGIAYWASALASFLKSECVAGHRIVMISHSAGASATVYASKFFPRERMPFKAIILVEPPLTDRDASFAHKEERDAQVKFITKSMLTARTSWKDRREAYQWMASRRPWRSWDPKVLQLYTEYALHEGHDDHDDHGNCHVTLNCSKQREIDGFTDFEDTFDATDLIAHVCDVVPVHIIFGGINDLIPKYAQESIVNASKGRHVTSISVIPKVGHLVVQEKPGVLSGYVAELLRSLDPPVSRL